MDSFIYSDFVCDECNGSNPETDVYFDTWGDYEVLCAHCGGTHRFGNVNEDRESAAHDAYNDMVRGK